MDQYTARVLRPVYRPRFEFLFRNLAGSSIEQLDLHDSKFEMSADLVYMLSETPKLLHLDLQGVEELDMDVYNAISRLARLRELDVRRASTSNDCLVRLANGPSRYSLRRIRLSWFSGVFYTIATSRFFKERFDVCNAEYYAL